MRKKLSQIIIICYCLTLFLHLYAIASPMPDLRVITKSLLLPLLITFLIVSTPNTNNIPIKNLALTALFFSWLGDVLLIQDGNFFLLGMLSFMTAHIRNTRLLLRLHPFRLKSATWIGIALVLGTISCVYFFLQHSLGTFLIPVVIYMVVIGIVWVLSFNLYNHPNFKVAAYNYFIPGMLLFVLSDSMLALNKFLIHQPERWDIWVMLTYALAQLLLTLGYTKVIPIQPDDNAGDSELIHGK